MVQRVMSGSIPTLPSSLLPWTPSPMCTTWLPHPNKLLSLANHPPKSPQPPSKWGQFPLPIYFTQALFFASPGKFNRICENPSFLLSRPKASETGRAPEMYFKNCLGYIYLALCCLGPLPGTAKECFKKMQRRCVSRQIRVHYHSTVSPIITTIH